MPSFILRNNNNNNNNNNHTRHSRCYEDPALQAHARACIPVDTVLAYARELSEAAAAAGGGEGWSAQACVLKGLMKWFKRDFFSWCNKPKCPNAACGRGGPQQEATGGAAPSEQERTLGWASIVETYRCSACGTAHRTSHTAAILLFVASSSPLLGAHPPVHGIVFN